MHRCSYLFKHKYRWHTIIYFKPTGSNNTATRMFICCVPQRSHLVKRGNTTTDFPPVVEGLIVGKVKIKNRYKLSKYTALSLFSKLLIFYEVFYEYARSFYNTPVWCSSPLSYIKHLCTEENRQLFHIPPLVAPEGTAHMRHINWCKIRSQGNDTHIE